MIATVSSAAARLMSAQNTRAPSRANATAVALPLPQPGPIDPAPTTSATLPLSRSAMSVLPYWVASSPSNNTIPHQWGWGCRAPNSAVSGLLDLVPDAGSVPSGLSRDDWARLPTNVHPASPEAADRRYAWGNAMQLSADQLRDFDEQGYLFFPNCFSEEEIALLRDDAEAILKLDRQEVWREKTGAPRTAFAAHTFNETFRLLASHPRLVEPLRQLFGEDVYVHQFKLNAKAAFEGDVWQWHQDYGTWARDDGMPEARAMNIAVFLDEVMPINGPLLLIPRSHKQGVLTAGHDQATTSYPLWTLDQETVTRLAAEAAGADGVGIVAPTGKPGSVLMFHGNLVHASPPNITPYPRKIVYLTLCAVSNHITKFTRPEWIAHRDFRPIVPVEDDALIAHARAHRVAAE